MLNIACNAKLALLAGIAPSSAVALPLPPGISDLLTIVDDAGQPVKDSLGNPAIRALSEADKVPGPNSLVIDLGTPTAVLRSTSVSTYLLTEPDSTFSDVISIAVQQVPSETTRVALCEPVSDCVLPLVSLLPVPTTPETGQLQDVASFFAPDGTHVHVLVQSAVPEPSTALLLLSALGCMSVVRRRMRSVA